MILLTSGVCLWALVHLTPGLAPGVKQSLMNRLGEGGYKGIFSLLILSALTLIIVGWRSSTPAYVYQPIDLLRPLIPVLMVVSIALFSASNRPSRIGRIIRHPQLTGLLVWSLAHLSVNGDSRSIILFGGLGLWSLLEIIAINRREGSWEKPEAPGWGVELGVLLAVLVVVAVLMYVHPWIAGVPVI